MATHWGKQTCGLQTCLKGQELLLQPSSVLFNYLSQPSFFQVQKSVMKHNFFLCVFTMAGTVMALYYQTFIEKLRSCPIKLAYGQSGTGKTTAVHYGLGLMGVHNLWFFCDLSPAKVFQLCLVTSKPRLQACHKVESALQHHHLLAALSPNLFAITIRHPVYPRLPLKPGPRLQSPATGRSSHFCLPSLTWLTFRSSNITCFIPISCVYNYFLLTTCTKVVSLFLQQKKVFSLV